jgi:ATP-dependent exoDNAse (exonuclease V) alpha subunit
VSELSFGKKSSLDAQDLTPCQLKAMISLRGPRNIFLTGSPGTGKSFIIGEYLKELSYRPPVLASTGAAAILIGGRTFHSFFGLGIMQGGIERTLERAKENRRLKTRLRKTSMIIIDEVSMLSHETLDCAEKIARSLLKREEPWGGIRVIAVGDFAQLPPVSRERNKPWAFLGEAWAKSQFEWVELQEIVRSENEDFNRILGKIRWGNIDSEVESFLEAKHLDDIDMDVPRIFSRRVQTEAFNQERLREMDGMSRFYETKYTGQGRAIETLMKEAPIPPSIELKPGVMVMIRMNDPKQRYVNGSLAKVVDLFDEKIILDLKGRMIELEKFSFSYQDADGNEIAAATNFPLSLAYAHTIHKVQGATLDRVHLDLARLWEPGQAYVALSRVRDPQRLSISSWTRESFIASEAVEDFYRSSRMKRLLTQS